MGIDWEKYPHLDAIHNHRQRYIQTAVGKTVFWEPKRDGSNISVMFHKDFFIVFTRNQKAIESVEIEVKRLLKPHMESLKTLLKENWILYGELCRKGKSPARFEVNDEASFHAFDLYSIKDQAFLDPTPKYKMFEKYNIPFLKAEHTTEIINITHFEQVCDNIIEIAKSKGLEGYVAKWYDHKTDEQYSIKVKVEHKYPKPGNKKKPPTVDKRPELEYSEVTGAIRKVHDEIGDDIRVKRIAMPAIADAVRDEAKRHNKRNCHNLYLAYIEYLSNG